MPLTSAVVHPRMFTELTPVFLRQTATIQQRNPNVAPSSFGEPAGFSDFAGHINLPCSLQRASNIPAGERRTPDQTIANQFYVCFLAGRYPTIVPAMQCIVDSTTYNITDVISDSQASHTQLTLELTKP